MNGARMLWPGLLIALLLPLASCGLFGGDEEGPDEQRTLAWDGFERRFRIHVPPSYDATRPAPLVLAFHGSGGSGAAFQAGTRFDEEADRNGFITVYPDNLGGNWAEGCGCNYADEIGIDDIGFAEALIDTLKTEFSIDPDRVYALGFSQGALFVQRVACELSEKVAAVAGVAATLSTPLAEVCAPSSPISVLVMHGTEDPVFPWEGATQGALSVLSADATIGKWVALNQCFGEASTSAEPIENGLFLRHEVYDRCEEDVEIHLYAVEGGGHAWPTGDVDTGKIIATFFSTQSKR